MQPHQNDSVIDAFVEDHGCLNALPESAVRILKLLRDPNFRMERLLKLIKQDAAIAARIIQVVNSAAYARSNRITELDRATIYLGVNTVKEIVAAATVQSICKPAVVGKYNTRDLWEHSIGVAILSREFAIHSKVIDPELAFLAGILHDVGLLLSAQSETGTSEEIFLDAEDKALVYTQIEKGYFGFDHCELGGRLAAAWHFPEEVAAVIRWHHSPEMAPDKFRQLCTHVFIADTLCAKAAIGFPLTCALQKADDESFTIAELTHADAEEVMRHFKVLLRLHMS